MVMVVISLSQIIVTSGLDLALIQRKNTKEEHYGSVFYFNIFIGFILGLSVFLSAEIIADFYKHPELKNLIRGSSLLFIIYALGRVKTAWLSKNLLFNILSKANLFSLISGGIGAVVLAGIGFGAWALLFQHIISGLVYVLYIYIANPWRPVLTFSKSAFRELWSFGNKLFLSTFINNISSQIDNLLVGRLFNQTILGFFYRSKNINSYIITLTSSSFSSVFFPVLSKIQDDKTRFINVFHKSFHTVNYISFIFISWILVISKDLILILFTSKWLGSLEYFQILLIGAWVYPISSMMLMILTTRGNSKAYLILETIKQITVISALIIGFLNSINLYLYSFVIALYLSVFLNAWFAGKELGVKIVWFIKIIGQYFLLFSFIVAFCMSLDYFLLPQMDTYLHALISSFVFFSLSILGAHIFRLFGQNLVFSEINDLIKKRINTH